MAKNASGAAFMQSKKKLEERRLAVERGLEVDSDLMDDMFELQHHHLLHCLEKTTVSMAPDLSVHCAFWLVT